MPVAGQTLRKIIAHAHQELLADWIREQLGASTLRTDLMKDNE